MNSDLVNFSVNYDFVNSDSVNFATNSVNSDFVNSESVNFATNSVNFAVSCIDPLINSFMIIIRINLSKNWCFLATNCHSTGYIVASFY